MTDGGPELLEVLTRCAVLAPLYQARRVLEIGAAATGGKSTRWMLERGAASVVALDRDAPPGADRRFDLVLLHDARELLDDPRRAAALRARVEPSGWLVAVCPAVVAHEHARVAAALQAGFPSVEMVAQSSMAAYTFAPFGPDELPIAVDWSLQRASIAASYLFLCGESPARLQSVCWVPVPGPFSCDHQEAALEIEFAKVALAEAQEAAQEAESAAWALERALALEHERLVRTHAELAKRGPKNAATRTPG